MEACGVSKRMFPFEHFDEHVEQRACMLEAPRGSLEESWTGDKEKRMWWLTNKRCNTEFIAAQLEPQCVFVILLQFYRTFRSVLTLENQTQLIIILGNRILFTLHHLRSTNIKERKGEKSQFIDSVPVRLVGWLFGHSPDEVFMMSF